MSHRAGFVLLAAVVASSVFASDVRLGSPRLSAISSNEPPAFVESAPGEFTLHSGELVVRLNAEGLVFAAQGRSSVFWSWVDGAPRELSGVTPSETPYFRSGEKYGPRSAFQKITAADVWPGIDVSLESRAGGIEYSVVLNRAKDLDRVRFRYVGGELSRSDDRLTIKGDLPLTETMGRCSQSGLVSCAVSELEQNGYGFSASGIDPEAPLLVDPRITWALGNNSDLPFKTATNLYARQSDLFLFGSGPAGIRPDGGPAPDDVFLTRIVPGTGQRAWVAQLGGTGTESSAGVTLDQNSNIFLCGTTDSPIFISASGCSNPFGQEGFVMELTPDAGTMLFDNCIDGAGDDQLLSCDAFTNSVGATDFVVGGKTNSGGMGFPSAPTPPWDLSYQVNGDGFIAYLSGITGTRVWLTYVGGSGTDSVNAIAVRGTSIFAAGKSDSPDIPAMGSNSVGPPASLADGFALMLNQNGGPGWWRWLGGNGDDSALAISGNSTTVFVGGLTNSSTSTLTQTTSLAGFGTNGGINGNGFIAAMNATDGASQWFTYVGGNDYDQVDTLDAQGGARLFYAGRTASQDLPRKNPLQVAYSGGALDGFVGAIDLPSRQFLSQGYIGGNRNDRVNAIKFDTTSLYLAGTTDSTDFPLDGGQQAFRAWVARTDNWPSDPNAGQDAGTDAGELDAGANDAGEVDAGTDAGEVDAGEDAGAVVETDGGVDGGQLSTTRSPAGCGCDGAPGTMVVALIALGAAMVRRRTQNPRR